MASSGGGALTRAWRWLRGHARAVVVWVGLALAVVLAVMLRSARSARRDAEAEAEAARAGAEGAAKGARADALSEHAESLEPRVAEIDGELERNQARSEETTRRVMRAKDDEVADRFGRAGY